MVLDVVYFDKPAEQLQNVLMTDIMTFPDIPITVLLVYFSASEVKRIPMDTVKHLKVTNN